MEIAVDGIDETDKGNGGVASPAIAGIGVFTGNDGVVVADGIGVKGTEHEGIAGRDGAVVPAFEDNGKLLVQLQVVDVLAHAELIFDIELGPIQLCTRKFIRAHPCTFLNALSSQVRLGNEVTQREAAVLVAVGLVNLSGKLRVLARVLLKIIDKEADTCEIQRTGGFALIENGGLAALGVDGGETGVIGVGLGEGEQR